MTTHRNRLEACLSGKKPDRTPISLWRHFPVDDQSAEGLAKAIINYQNTYDFDFIKVTPSSSYCLEDWGTKDEWLGSTEGTRDYTHRIISKPEDWIKLPLLDPYKGSLSKQLSCLNILIDEFGYDIPIIQTIFNPLSQAKNLAGNQVLLSHMRRYPNLVHEGLAIISKSTQLFIEALTKIGLQGIFYAVQHAQYGLLSPGEYDEFGMKYDLQVLEPTNEMWFNLLHIHGSDIMFDKFLDYPVQVLNWHDQETSPNLKLGLEKFNGVVCGGLRRIETLVLGDSQSIEREAQAAIMNTNGVRFILGTGCVVPINAPFGNISAARKSVE